MRRFAVVVLAALFAVSCAREVELTVVAPAAKLLDKPDAAGAAVLTKDLGSRLKGRRGKKGWWRVALPEGKEGFAPPETLAPYPVQGQPRWVVAPMAGQLAEPDLASRAITARYEIGTALEVVGGAPWLPPDVAAVVSTGVVIGFIPVKAIGDREPKAGDLLLAGREALLAGKVNEALMQGRRALSLDPKHAGARALVAAIHEANGDPQAEAMQDALVVPAVEPPAATVKEGDAAFVGIASLELHKGKGQTTEVLTRLGINTPVTVRALDGKWAQVAWKGQPDVGRNLDIDPFLTPAPKPAASVTATPEAAVSATPVAAASATPEAAATAAATPTPVITEEVVGDEETTLGWVLAGHLAPAEQNAAATASVARQRLAEGKAVEAVELFERAATLEPSNLELTKELLEAAVKADRYLVAAFAALSLDRGGADLGGLEVSDSDYFYGCRGDKFEAEWVSGTTAPEAGDTLEENACVSDVDSEPPCEPCEYYAHDDYYEEHHDCEDCGDEGVEEEATPEESDEERERRLQIERAEAEAAAAREAIEQAERDAEAERQRKEHEAEVAEHGVYLTKIDTAYPSSPYVYFEIRNRQAGRMAGAKIQIYRVAVSNQYGDSYYDTSTLEIGEVQLPPLGPNASVGLWIEAPSYVGWEYGVVRLPDVESARVAIERGLSANDGTMPPHFATSVEGKDCSCGGC